jgi:large subunit ribosomal protein L4
LKGELISKIVLPKIFDTVVDESQIAQAIRVYQMATRQGTSSTKTRGEVHGSSRKIYAQKGTGRARHGNIRAPIFVGGGIVFGPKPRNFTLKLSKTMKKQVLSGLLSNCQKQKIVSVVKDFDKATGKTKEIANLISKMNLQNKKILLILTPDLKKTIQAAANIANVTLRPANALSPLDVFTAKHLIFAQNSLDKINPTQK